MHGTQALCNLTLPQLCKPSCTKQLCNADLIVVSPSPQDPSSLQAFAFTVSLAWITSVTHLPCKLLRALLA